MKKYFTIIVSILMVIALVQMVSCEKAETPYPPFNCSSLSDTTHIRYVADTVFDPKSIQVLVTQYCSYQSGCHEEGSINGDFTTYQGIKAKADNGSLYIRVVVNRDMPPLYSFTYLDSCQVKEFYLWIKEGAPQY